MGSATTAPAINFFDPFGFQRAAASMLQTAADIAMRTSVQAGTAMMANMKNAAEIMTGHHEAAASWDIPNTTPDALLKSDYGPLLFFAPKGAPHAHTAYIVPPISFSEPEVVNTSAKGFAEEGFNVAVNHWRHPKDFAKDAAAFDLDKNIDQIIDGLIAIYHETGAPADVLMGISQSTIPVALAAAIMEEHGHPAAPRKVMLFAGPYNVQKNLTSENRLAMRSAEDCFDAMFPRMPIPLLRGMTRNVFKSPVVAKGDYVYEGKYERWHGPVDPAHMTETPVLVAEGTEDKICPVTRVKDRQGKVTYVGQTSAFFDRSQLHADNRVHVVRETDHYGVFDLTNNNDGARKKVMDFARAPSIKAAPQQRMAGTTPRASVPVFANASVH